MNKVFEQLRPHPQMLALLLRSAVADDGHGGPWLYIGRTLDAQTTVHHIGTGTEGPIVDSPTRMMMLSGESALAFAVAQGWGHDVLHPTATQLRALTVHAMMNRDAALWARHHLNWQHWITDPELQLGRVRQAHEVRSMARALRWQIAEQWLAAR